MEFKVGDKVSFLNEKLDGVISQVYKNDKVEVMTADGFGFPALSKELILIERPDNNQGKSIPEEKRQEKIDTLEESEVFKPVKKIKKVVDVMDREKIRQVIQEKMQTKVVGKISLQHSHRRKEVEGEVDLHIEHLLDNWKNMSNGEIVLHQLSIAREAIDDAILGGKHRLVLIHGVGNGTLKKEVRNLVNSYPGLRCEDGHFGVYGAGATLVHL